VGTAVLADIVSGKTSTADVFFLIAWIIFALSIIVCFVKRSPPNAWNALVSVGLALVAIAFWVL
jgi:hypothetical protein